VAVGWLVGMVRTKAVSVQVSTKSRAT
jgi:hypothetical protein